MWLYPAQRISADLESQSWRMRHDLHAIGFAMLGAAWWKQDRSAAEHWVYPAVDEVTIASQDEAEIDRGRRLQAARRLLSIVVPLDRLLGDRLKDIIKDTAERATTYRKGVSWQTADALVDAAEQRPAPELAGAISEALQYSVSASVVAAIDKLRESSPTEADRLFEKALALAMSSNDPEYMRAFAPVLTAPSDAGIPQRWQQEAADAYARALSGDASDQVRRCVLASESDAIREEVESGLARAIAAAVAECNSGISDPVLAADAQTLQRADPKTSDDYLSVAGQSRSPISRYNVKLTASEKAEKEDLDSENGGPVRALRIFDGMTPEERAARPGEYKRRRAEEAIRAALFTDNKSGCPAAVRLVDSSPRETIFHVAVGVAEKIESVCLSPVFDIAMRQMRRNPPEDPNDYIRLMNVALRRHVPQVTYVVQEILRGMDEWKAKDAKLLRLGEVAYEAPWNNLLPMPIATELLDMNVEWLSAIARGSFRNDLLRADFELLLVRGFLDRYAREAAKRKAEMAESAKP